MSIWRKYLMITNINDYIGQFVKLTPEFKGKWRIIRY